MSLKLLRDTLSPISRLELERFLPKKVKSNSFAIMFDNFLRDSVTFELIKSIQEHYPTVKMYIAEQGIFDKNKDDLYKKLTAAGHKIIYVGFDAGLSVCRNKLVDLVEEPYVFYCDSDNQFIDNTKIELLEDILKEDKELGLVSCFEYNNDNVNHYEINLEWKDNYITYLDIPLEILNTNNDIFYCDMTMNVGLFRTDVFKDVRWDSRMKLAEHLDFFLSLKYKSSWKVACAKHVSIKNQNFKINNTDYDAYRNRNKEFWKLYENKWNVKTINGWVIPQVCPTSMYEGNVVVPKKVSEGVLAEEKILESIIVNTPDVVIPEENKIQDLQEAILSFLKEIKNYKAWILNNSCLEIVKHKKFINCNLEIGTVSKEVKLKIRNIYNSKVRQFVLNIEVEPNRIIKVLRVINNVSIYVPCPVVTYLSEKFNVPNEGTS